MANINSARTGCRDVFHAYLVSDADYDGEIEIPVIEPSDKIPNRLISFSKAMKEYNSFEEFDKKADSNDSKDISRGAVQNSLLKILEGTKLTLEVKDGMGTKNMFFDTSELIIICCGAFDGLDEIDEIVLGFPKNMNNTIGERAQICLDFKDKLIEKTKLDVIMEDERLTSKVANNFMIKEDISRKKRKERVDGMAAVIILQSYLDRKVF